MKKYRKQIDGLREQLAKIKIMKITKFINELQNYDDISFSPNDAVEACKTTAVKHPDRQRHCVSAINTWCFQCRGLYYGTNAFY